MHASLPRRRALGAGLVTLLLAACAPAAPDDPATAYRDAPLLHLAEEVRFCADEESPGCMLGSRTFVNATPHGGVIIGQPNGPITGFDATGARVAEYGRPGGGPGEYRMVYGAHAEPDGRVVLHDFGQARRVVFAADGTPLVTHVDGPDFGIRDFELGVRGFAVLRDPPAEQGDSVRSEFRLLRDTLPPRIVGFLPLTRLSDEMGMSPVPGFFTDRARWDVESDSTALVAFGPTLSVVRHHADGRTEDVVRVPELGNRRVTSADVEAERRRRQPDGSVPEQMRAPLAKSVEESAANAADLHPFATALRALGDGTFLLRESEIRPDSTVRWTLFDADGAVLGQLSLAPDTEVVSGTRERLLLKSPDERDVPVVAWHRVTRAEG